MKEALEKRLLPEESLTWHYMAEQVNDFAWATSNEFIWKATRATIPGKGEIPIHMFYLPERADRFARAGELGRHALEFYSNLWAPYAFPTTDFSRWTECRYGISNGREFESRCC